MATMAEIQNKLPGGLTLAAAKDILPATWTIRGVESKTFGQGASAETVLVLTFVENEKYLTINKSRATMLADLFKADEELSGKKVALAVEIYEVKNKGPCPMVVISEAD